MSNENRDALDRMIEQAWHKGMSFSRSRDGEQAFNEFQQLLDQIVGFADKLELKSEAQKITLNFIKTRRPNDYRLNLIEKVFYFKRYQYIFPRALTGNSELQMKKRYVMDIIERLQLLL